MNAVLIAAAGMIILLLLIHIASRKVIGYEKEIMSEYLSLGMLTLGRMENEESSPAEIKNYLKLTNTF